MKNVHERIKYVEFPAKGILATKAFLDECLDDGFLRSDKVSSTGTGSALTVYYSKDLNATQSKIEKAGGQIVKPKFSFPGGYRFHFSDPNGNECTVQSDTEAH